nr:putative reverse transcriptase, RNA-dependent DNA polymerase, Gag-polypeptide of LTR copia-type [Tanacetum cinerariifolium]
MGDNSNSEGNVLTSSALNTQRNLLENSSLVQPDIRKSSRSGKMLAKFNDYVVGSSRKYRLENVTYSKLNSSNFCLSTTLNKSYEPNTYYEAIKNPNWIEAMNKEIKALNRNNTSTICDHPEGRKPVGSKWLYKIKYKSTREIERYKEKAGCQGLQPEGWDLIILKLLSSTEAGYRSMASATCEAIWLCNLLGDMGVKGLLHVVLYCNNSSALHIAANLIFHEILMFHEIETLEIDVHLVRKSLQVV